MKKVSGVYCVSLDSELMARCRIVVDFISYSQNNADGYSVIYHHLIYGPSFFFYCHLHSISDQSSDNMPKLL